MEVLERPHVVDVVNQGDRHSDKPPLAEIKVMIEKHLGFLDPSPRTQQKYQARIGRKVNRSASFDVKIGAVLEHNVKAVQVRIRNGQGYWIGELICPDMEQAADLFLKANPSSGNHLVNVGFEKFLVDIRIENAPVVIAMKMEKGEESFSRAINSACKQLFKRNKIGEVCLSAMPEESDRVLAKALIEAIINVTGLINPRKDLIRAIFDRFVLAGYVTPHIGRGHAYLAPTELFLETRADHLEFTARERKEGLQRNLDTKRRLCAAKVREREGFQKRVEECNKVIKGMEAEIAEMERQLQEV